MLKFGTNTTMQVLLLETLTSLPTTNVIRIILILSPRIGLLFNGQAEIR